MRMHFTDLLHRTVYFRLLWLIVGLTIAACGGDSFLSNETASSLPLSPPPSWHRITPGQTLLEEALDILGQPDSIERRYGYEVYRYLERKDLGNWELVELWIAEHNESLMVVGVLRAWPRFEKDRSIADVQTLAQLVEQYKRSDKTTWTTSCKQRYLIWAHEGVAASVAAQPNFFYPEEYLVNNILLFAPVQSSQFMSTPWPYPDTVSEWSSQNPCPSQNSDAPDTLPEDLYDWDKLLTATPSATTQP